MVLWLTFTHHFLLLLLLIFQLLTLISTAYSSKENKSAIDSGIHLQMHRNEKMYQGVGEIINRKMMMSRRFWKHWKIAEASSSSNNNGEAEIIMRGGLNINERRTTRRRRSMRVKNMSSGGFVSWNADYHVPRLHPPKNN